LAFDLARTFSSSTGADVSIAVAFEPSENHSRMVASRPTETALMWFLMMDSGIPSAWHFSTMAFELIPSSFAISKTRLANRGSSH
jgi:hypothetical protein